MPKLPSRETAFGPDRAPSVQRPIARYTSAGLDAPARAAAEQGEAFARIGGMGFELGRKMVQKEVQKESAHARSTLLQADVDAQANIPLNRDNHANFVVDYRKSLEGTLSETLAGVKSASTRSAIEADFGVMVERGAVNMQNRAIDREGEVGRAALAKKSADALTALGSTADPGLRNDLIEAYGDELLVALNNGWINEEQYGAQGRAFAITHVTNWITAMPPEDRIEVLLGGYQKDEATGVVTFDQMGSEIDLLPAETRLRLIDTTENELAQSEVANANSHLTVTDIKLRAAIAADTGDLSGSLEEYTVGMDAAIKAGRALITDDRQAKIYDAAARVVRATGIAYVQGEIKKRLADTARASVTEQLDAFLTAALNTTNRADQDALRENARIAIESLLTARFIKAEKATSMESAWAQSFAVGWVESFTPEAQLAALNKGAVVGDNDRITFEPTGTHVDDIPPEVRIEMLDQANRALSGANAAGRAMAKNALNDIDNLILAGEQPAAASLALVQGLVAGHPDLEFKLEEALAIGEMVGTMSKRPTWEIQEEYTRLDGKDKTPSEFRAMMALEGLLTRQTRELARDALSYAMGTGVVAPMSALNPADPESVKKHIAAALRIKERYGVDADPLTDERLAEFSQEWDDADSMGRVVMLDAWANMNMPKEMADRFYDKVSSGAPSMGLLAEAVRNGHTDIVRQHLLGVEQLKEFPDDKPQEIDVRASLDAELGNALDYSDPNGTGLRAVLDAMIPAYVASVNAAGGDPTLWDTGASLDKIVSSATFQELFQAFVGEIGSRNGRDFITPLGMSAKEFERRVNGMPDNVLHWTVEGISQGPHRLGADGIEQMSAGDLRRAEFVSIGDGKYLLLFPDGAGGFAVNAYDGEEYVFDLKAIEAGSIGGVPIGIGTEQEDTAGDEATLRGAAFMANSVVNTEQPLDDAWESRVVGGLKSGDVSEYRVREWLMGRGFTSTEAAKKTADMAATAAKDTEYAAAVADDTAKGADYMENAVTIHGDFRRAEWQGYVVEGLKAGRINEASLIEWLMTDGGLSSQDAAGRALGLRAQANK